MGTEDIEAGWKVFFETEKASAVPDAVILQAEHAELAGELAAHLLPGIFGELRREVVEAAARHDCGWAESDQRQIATKPPEALKPFTELRGEDVVSWRRSLKMADAWHPLTRVLISRHFSLLANQPGPEHEQFVREETERRAGIERLPGCSKQDLKRWTGAVGLCDLLSLYLCCGTDRPASFPLAHPAAPEASEARRFTVSWENGELAFSEPVFAAGVSVGVEALRLDAARGLTPVRLEWRLR